AEGFGRRAAGRAAQEELARPGGGAGAGSFAKSGGGRGRSVPAVRGPRAGGDPRQCRRRPGRCRAETGRRVASVVHRSVLGNPGAPALIHSRTVAISSGVSGSFGGGGIRAPSSVDVIARYSSDSSGLPGTTTARTFTSRRWCMILMPPLATSNLWHS